VAGNRVYDGDMASETTVKANEPEVKPSRTPTVIEAYNAMQPSQVRERRKIESMDDLTPEERAQQLRFAEKLRALAGKIHLDIDLDELRGRNR